MCKSSEVFLSKNCEKKKGKLTNLETRNLAVRALFAVRPFTMNWTLPFGIVVILGFALIPSTYSRGENQFIKWKMKFPSLLDIHKASFSFRWKSWKINANAKGRKLLWFFNPNTDGFLFCCFLWRLKTLQVSLNCFLSLRTHSVFLVGQSHQKGHLDIGLGAQSDLYLLLFPFSKGNGTSNCLYLQIVWWPGNSFILFCDL